MRILVTGADGFVGFWLCRSLLGAGHEVIGAYHSAADAVRGRRRAELADVRWVVFDLADPGHVEDAAGRSPDAVVHLAAMSSGAEARLDPARAWLVNAVGTARILNALGEQVVRGKADPLVVLASSAEVYGQRATRPSREADAVEPCSPYAASKAGAELAASEVAARTGLRLVITRPFTQFGPGQDSRFLLPALARRLREAAGAGSRSVRVGNLEPVRDFVDVRDAADAVMVLLRQGRPGETYNISTGVGHRLLDMFNRLAGAVGVEAVPVADPALFRSADLPYLVGDPEKLRSHTGWTAATPVERTVTDLVAELDGEQDSLEG